MLLSEVLILLPVLQWVTGHQYCSRDAVQVDCQPCGVTCQMGKQTCFTCPKQCDKGIDVATCKSVCSDTCKNGICEYFRGQLKCSEGCKSGFTGMHCQEYCPQSCKSCDQFSLNCTSSGDGDDADNYVTSERDVPDPTIQDDEEQTNSWTVLGIPVGVAAAVLAILCIAGLAYKAGVKVGRKERDSTCVVGFRDRQSSTSRDGEARDSRTHSYITITDTHVDLQPNPISSQTSGNSHSNLYENMNRSRRNKNTNETEVKKMDDDVHISIPLE